MQGLKVQDKPRVLIVDDESQFENPVRLWAETLMSPWQKVALRGWKALKLLPDLILLDIVMPEMDGFETIKKLRENEVLAEVPVIFITGLDTADNEKYGLISVRWIIFENPLMRLL